MDFIAQLKSLDLSLTIIYGTNLVRMLDVGPPLDNKSTTLHSRMTFPSYFPISSNDRLTSKQRNKLTMCGQFEQA